MNIASIIQYDNVLLERGSSLIKESSDVWGWYLEFFKKVIELQNDPTADKVEYSTTADFSFAKQAKIVYRTQISRGDKEDKTVFIYEMSCRVPIPSGWFLTQIPSGDDRYEKTLPLVFTIIIDPSQNGKSIVTGTGGKSLKISLYVFVKKEGKLILQYISVVKPKVKACITHELRHIFERSTHDKIQQYDTMEKGETSSKDGFTQWLMYLNGRGETSASSLCS
jgi:hypothetical protein